MIKPYPPLYATSVLTNYTPEAPGHETWYKAVALSSSHLMVTKISPAVRHRSYIIQTPGAIIGNTQGHPAGYAASHALDLSTDETVYY